MKITQTLKQHMSSNPELLESIREFVRAKQELRMLGIKFNKNGDIILPKFRKEK